MPGHTLLSFAKHMLATLLFWAARGRERRHLETLDDHMLADIGVTREAALREASRPPWQGSRRPAEGFGAPGSMQRRAPKNKAVPERRFVKPV